MFSIVIVTRSRQDFNFAHSEMRILGLKWK